ncbi:hypothetical protein IDM32_04580 [Acinetobacter seifertii]|nr:hypothetical protein [Acinetobacter seifertii]
MVIAKLFLATGRRPIQIANLKVKDFVGVTVIDGNKFDLLRVPKVKQRDIWRKNLVITLCLQHATIYVAYLKFYGLNNLLFL